MATKENSATEEVRMDQAFHSADELLVESLKIDERRRRRKKIWITFITIGAIIMISLAKLFLSGMLATTTVVTTTDKVQQAASLSQEGWQLWQKRKLTDAEAKFNESLKLDPTASNTWNGLGWSLTNQGRTQEAEKAFNEAIKIEPNHPAAQNGLGWIAFGRNQRQEAESHWLKSSQTPGSSAAWSGLAQLYLLEGKWDAAAQYAQKTLDSGDTSAQIFLTAAQAKHLDPALRKQIEPQTSSPTAANVKKGWMLLNKGNTQQAIAAFNEALKTNPKDADAENGLGWALMRTGQNAEAQSHFESALRLNPDAAGSINGLAMVLNSQGKTDLAIVLWQKMIDNYPTPNAGTTNLAAIYLQRKEFSKALPLYEQLSAAMPNDPQIQQALQQARAGK